MEERDFERKIVSLLFVLRALVEGAPRLHFRFISSRLRF